MVSDDFGVFTDMNASVSATGVISEQILSNEEISIRFVPVATIVDEIGDPR